MRFLFGLTALILAGACVGSPVPTVTSSPTNSASPSPPASPSATAAPTLSAAATSIEGSIGPASESPTLSLPPQPTPTPAPTVAGELSLAQVRYLLMDQLGPLHYCDPDYYPIGRGDEQQKAIAEFPTIRADSSTFVAIVTRLGIASQTTFSDTDKLNIYREWKTLNAVDAQPLGNGTYQFDVTTEGNASSGQALHMQGTVDAKTGTISIATQQQVFGVSCPICLARGTLIATPEGPRPVEQLQPGDPIWTVGASGQRVASVVARVGSVPVPPSHEVVDLLLADGRELQVSPGHPLPDGRHAGDLRAGDWLDGATVISATLIAYDGGRTFDVLPAGATGFYWANGVLLASTLR